jgi:hypothetical protein
MGSDTREGYFWLLHETRLLASQIKMAGLPRKGWLAENAAKARVAWQQWTNLYLLKLHLTL